MKDNRKNRKRLKMIQKKNPQGLVLNGSHVLLAEHPLEIDTVNALSSLIKAVKKMKL